MNMKLQLRNIYFCNRNEQRTWMRPNTSFQVFLSETHTVNNLYFLEYWLDCVSIFSIILRWNSRFSRGFLDFSDFKFTIYNKSDHSVESYFDMLPKLVSKAFLSSTEFVVQITCTLVFNMFLDSSHGRWLCPPPFSFFWEKKDAYEWETPLFYELTFVLWLSQQIPTHLKSQTSDARMEPKVR